MMRQHPIAATVLGVCAGVVVGLVLAMAIETVRLLLPWRTTPKTPAGPVLPRDRGFAWRWWHSPCVNCNEPGRCLCPDCLRLIVCMFIANVWGPRLIDWLRAWL